MENVVFKSLFDKEKETEERVLDLMKTNNQDVYEKTHQEIEAITADSKLKVAFAGLYNSGKSTIIQALTGDDNIQISSNVQTDETAEYEWGKVLLYDTPGIKAGVQDQHDIDAMMAIKNADIIVFCITASLMDSSFLDDFTDLSYNHYYKNKIILLVNKMSLEEGDYDVLVNNYKETLEKNLQSYGGELEDFPVCFIDAADYQEGIKTSDDELIAFSRFGDFIQMLNNQIRQRDLYAKLVSRYTVLNDGICQAIAFTGTDLDINMMRVLDRLSKTIRHKKKDVWYRIQRFKDELKREIQDVGNREITQKIGNEDISDSLCENAKIHIQEVTDKKVKEIEEYLYEADAELNEEIAGYLTDSAGSIVIEVINNAEFNEESKAVKDYSKLLTKYSEVSKTVSSTSARIARMALANGTGNVAKLADVAGSELHLIVKSIGQFFGKGFKPWGAVKIASKIGKVAKYAGPVMEGLGVVLTAADKIYSESQISKVNKLKKNSMNTFSDIALGILKEIDNQYTKQESIIFSDRLKEIDDIKNEMIEESDSNKSFIKQLQDEQKNISNALDEIKQIESDA